MERTVKRKKKKKKEAVIKVIKAIKFAFGDKELQWIDHKWDLVIIWGFFSIVM